MEELNLRGSVRNFKRKQLKGEIFKFYVILKSLCKENCNRSGSELSLQLGRLSHSFILVPIGTGHINQNNMVVHDVVHF